MSELLIVSMPFEPSMSAFFLTSALPTLFTALCALSVDSMSRLNVIVMVSGIIICSIIWQYFDANMLAWVCYVWDVDFSDVFPFTFEGKLCSMFYHEL